MRIRGGGTKLGWGAAARPAAAELRTTALDRVLEHNVGDLTAVVQAGVPMARLQAQLAAEGQMLAIDPPLGNPGQAGHRRRRDRHRRLRSAAPPLRRARGISCWA